MQEKKAIDENDTIDLLALLRQLWSKAWLLVLVTVLGGAAALGYTAGFVTPTYRSTTKVYILNRQDEQNLTSSDLQLGSQLTSDYEVLVTSRPVIEETIEVLGLNRSYEAAAAMVSVSVPEDTRILSITVTSTSPEVAQAMANQVRESAAVHIREVMGIEAVNTVEEANYPTGPSSPSYRRNLMMGALLGFVVAAGCVTVRFLLDDTLHTPEDVEKYLGLSVLGSIPLESGKAKNKNGRKKGGRRG